MVFVISNQIFEPVEHSSPLIERAPALKVKASTKVSLPTAKRKADLEKKKQDK